MQKILIVEDEPNMLLGLTDALQCEGFIVSAATDGQQGIEKASTEKPDLVLLDVMLPRVSGFDVCRSLRGMGVAVPIIMLSARGQEIDKVIGLEIGADDYVTKPFSVQELLARVRAHLRRASRGVVQLKSFRFSDIELDFTRYLAYKAGEPIDVSQREFEILRYLINHRGEVVSRDRLLDDVWGYDSYPITRTVDNHIAKLRQKIEINPAEPTHILTVHRLGYRFID
jgi:DNA-binding response OmpR family regulator